MAPTPPKKAAARRRPATRRRHIAKAPERSDWEAAFSKLSAIDPKARENTAEEFLPKFVAALREKGFVQNEVVDQILALKLGVTNRQIRDADKAYRKALPTPRTPTSGAAPAPPQPAAPQPSPVPPAQPTSGTRGAGQRPHAGLAGDEGLHRR